MITKPRVSIITAVKDPNALFLEEAYNSLLKQTVVWEWLIQIDGIETDIPKLIAQDERVIIEANDKSYGSAIARNRALARSTAPVVQNLDGDDYLSAGALDAMLDHIQTNKYAFVFGKDLSVESDGTTRHYAGGLQPGVVLPGTIYERWQDIHMTPLHPAGIMWRKDVLLSYGGWHALSSGEDTAVMLAASVKYPVYFLDQDTFIYRQHKEQQTSREAYRDAKEANWSFITQRVDALSENIELSPL